MLPAFFLTFYNKPKMKKTITILSLQLLCCIFVYAQPRTQSEALEIAKQFFIDDARTRGMSANNSKLTLVSPEAIAKAIGRDKRTNTRSMSGSIGFFVFNDEVNNKYIIVSGDERQYEILGYSEDSFFDSNYIPCGLRILLAQYGDEYDYVQEHEVSLTESNTTRATTAISPLIKTTWSQGEPYNNSCPMDPVTKKRCVTGCVATAMAQIMNYYRQPAKGKGSNYYTSSKRKISQSMNFSSVAFDWSNMKNSYSGSYTSKEATAVATLMHACGVAVNMNYSSDGSGSSNITAGGALIDYFGYNSQMNKVMKGAISDSQYKDIIQTELKAKHPILYQGQGSGGHSFILDGCDNSGHYHFNWGWGGIADGYFALSSLTPKNSSGTHNYSELQLMVFNIDPKAEEIDVKSISVASSGSNSKKVTISYTPSDAVVYYRISQSGLTPSKTDTKYTEPFEIEENAIITAIAYKGNEKSEVFKKEVSSFKVSRPLIRTNGNKIEMSCNTPLSTIYYTLDGRTPTKTNGKRYTSTIEGTASATVKAVAVRNNWSDSEIATSKFTLVPVKLNITNVNAGQLSTKVGDSKLIATSLIVSGKLNGTDIKYIREMCEKGELEILNLKSATIIGGGNAYYGDVKTQDNIVGDYMFRDMTNLKSLELPSNTKQIGKSVFTNCTALNELTIPENCKEIGWHAFESSGLISLNIPKNVEDIGTGITTSCHSLRTITVSAANQNFDSRNNCNAIIKKSDNTLIAGCNQTVIPNSVTAIGISAFSDVVSDITIPGSVTDIGIRAFENNTTLKQVTLQDGVETISVSAFAGCSSLEAITLPKTIKTIYWQSFENCSSLQTINSYIEDPSVISKIGKNPFEGCPINKIILSIPFGTKSKYLDAYGWDILKSYNIVERLKEGAFIAKLSNDLDMIFMVTDEKEKTCQVGDETRNSTSAIRRDYEGRVAIPSRIQGYSVTRIADYAFSSKKLSSVSIPSTIKEIGTGAFSYSQKLAVIDLPDFLTKIGRNSFTNCLDLSIVTIPKYVKTIEDFAFSDCSELKMITSYIENPFPISDNVFTNYQDEGHEFTTATLYVPKGTRTKYESTAGWKNFERIIEMGESSIHDIMGDVWQMNGLYDLKGHKSPKPQKGIYIHNGKKVYIK